MDIDLQKLVEALKSIQYAIIDLEAVDPQLFEQYAMMTQYIDIANELEDISDEVRDVRCRLDDLARTLEELIAKLRMLEG